MEEYEKAFIKWTIAKLRQAKLPASQMIMTLRKKNSELAQYAEKIAPGITGSKEQKYRAEFQQAITEAILSSGDPQQAAKDFFAAIKLNPNDEEQIMNMINKK